MRIAEKYRELARTGQRPPRTGQDPIVVQGVTYMPDSQGRLVPTGTTGNRFGMPCGPVQATQAQSWGAACPPGFCTADQLAANLGRQYAGERYPCRELTYWIHLELDGAGASGWNLNSRVTICPTRIVAYSTDSTGAEVLTGLLSLFEIGSQNQIVGDPLPLEFLHPSSYQIIPFVTDCLKAGTPFSGTVTGGPVDGDTWIGLIGPAIG